jgi:hypothetical protein
MFFFDNTFSSKIVDILVILGVPATHLQHHFPPETLDVEWIPFVAEKGWVLVSGDQRIRRSPAERLAFERANLVTFFVHRAYQHQTIWEQVAWLVRLWPTIQDRAGKTHRGTSYEVRQNGQIERL